ncbi:DUF934 domain-containing protein [Tropicimonas sp. IMCC6043]|uniref:DUF934 domain-containing protein n=1 Tax=Tropicimonas sp. IMCC6043 TaxID=2510645 RepID=UPI00101D7BD0|nr:DUF934 domain-containing protein [Tropicimonas sp. IMCC6043]RYH08432.1 DUF934 domain-containing protein [Tropicimonas sp. IMCC6043]
MTTIVKDQGFASEDFHAPFAAPEDSDGARALDLPSDFDTATLAGFDGIEMIRVDFPSFADGRGFSIARALRRAGYGGRLRARGHVLADQYAMARRSGFDEVEIDESLAARQPEDQWRARADWREHDYRSRLAG